MDSSTKTTETASYEPTLEEIARECARIREGWSEQDYRNRATIRLFGAPVVVVLPEGMPRRSSRHRE
jgi:hypothetical protein